MTSKKVPGAVPPVETSCLGFIFGFWPVLLVYAVGPVGDIIMGRALVAEPFYPLAVAASLVVAISLFIVAGLWSYHPLARLLKGTEPCDCENFEAVVHALPYRVGKSFLFSGVLFATIGMVLLGFSYIGPTGRPPLKLVLGSALTNYYAFGLLTTVLGVASTLNFTTRLRKSLSTHGIFTGNLQSAPYSSSTHSSSMISVIKRPWQLFIITSVLPFLLIAILFMISRGMDDPYHRRAATTAMLQMFLGVLVCGTYLVYTMHNTMKLAIDELLFGMDSIRDGRYTKRVAVLLDDETGSMARSLNTSLEGLQERDDLKGALSIAAEIQSGLLPQNPPIPDGFTLETFQQSCYGVGGDYYDIIELDNGRMWVIVADVAGKGYSSALTVSNLHAIMHTLASSGQDFADVPKIANSAMGNTLTRGRFVTVFMAEFTPGSDTILWFNAGHTPAVLASADTKTLLSSMGPPLGILPELILTPKEQRLNPGDLLAVFTDGVTELRSRADRVDMFGMERTADWVGTHRSTRSPALAKKFLKELANFGTPALDDDLTVLFLKRIE